MEEASESTTDELDRACRLPIGAERRLCHPEEDRGEEKAGLDLRCGGQGAQLCGGRAGCHLEPVHVAQQTEIFSSLGVQPVLFYSAYRI